MAEYSQGSHCFYLFLHTPVKRSLHMFAIFYFCRSYLDLMVLPLHIFMFNTLLRFSPFLTLRQCEDDTFIPFHPFSLRASRALLFYLHIIDFALLSAQQTIRLSDLTSELFFLLRVVHPFMLFFVHSFSLLFNFVSCALPCLRSVLQQLFLPGVNRRQHYR